MADSFNVIAISEKGARFDVVNFPKFVVDRGSTKSEDAVEVLGGCCHLRRFRGV